MYLYLNSIHICQACICVCIWISIILVNHVFVFVFVLGAQPKISITWSKTLLQSLSYYFLFVNIVMKTFRNFVIISSYVSHGWPPWGRARVISRRHECIIFYSMHTFQFWAYTIHIYAFCFHFHLTLLYSSMHTLQILANTMHMYTFYFHFPHILLWSICCLLSPSVTLYIMNMPLCICGFVVCTVSWDTWYIPL